MPQKPAVSVPETSFSGNSTHMESVFGLPAVFGMNVQNAQVHIPAQPSPEAGHSKKGKAWRAWGWFSFAWWQALPCRCVWESGPLLNWLAVYPPKA